MPRSLLLASFVAAVSTACAAPAPRAQRATLASSAAQVGETPPSAGGAPAPTERESPADRGVLRHFSTRDPIYFDVGFRGRTNAKFQLGFQYRLLVPDAPRPEPPPFWKELYFGFTTTSIWNLEAESTPFFDSVYNPSFYWLRPRIERLSSEHLDFGVELGIEHESNGKGGDVSRSLNDAYLKPIWDWRIGEERHLTLQPKVWAYVGSLEDNPDVADYRGHFEVKLAAYDERGLGVSTQLGAGDGFDHASFELDLSYPMNRFVEELDAFLHLQLFTGWGETLATYDERQPTQVRLGILLAR